MYNKTILQGYIASDPKVTTKEAEGEIRKSAVYSIGVPRDFDRSKSDFFHCVVFGEKGTDFVQNYIKKGMMILVDGRLQTGEYLDSDGQKIKSISLIIEKHHFCGTKQDNAISDKEEFTSEPNGFPATETEPDDLRC